MSERLEDVDRQVTDALQVLRHALRVQLGVDDGPCEPRSTDRAIVDGDLLLARAFAMAADLGGAEVVYLAELLDELALESATAPVVRGTRLRVDGVAGDDRPPAWRPLAREIGIGPLARDLARVEAAIVDLLEVPGEPQVTEATTYLVAAGGKRLRPLLALLGHYAGQEGELRSAPDAAIEIAAAVETLHIFTLYHDDVIDNASTRRGVPTALHRWGVEPAIALGNVLCARSFGCAGRLGQRYGQLLAASLDEVCRGQSSELTSTFDVDRSEDDYVRSIGGKTAYLIASAARFGAMTVTEDTDPLLDDLWTVVYNYGVAFQVIDDLLDLVGSEAQIHKPVGTDIGEGVYTLPVLLALREDPALRKLLSPRPNPAQIQQVRARATATGAVTAAVEFAVDRCVAARQAILDSSRMHPDVSRALVRFEDAMFAPLIAAGVEVQR
jgi:heptaprenyl diphosphate synthase